MTKMSKPVLFALVLMLVAGSFFAGVMIVGASSKAGASVYSPVNPNSLSSRTPASYPNPPGIRPWQYMAYYRSNNGTLTAVVGCLQRDVRAPCIFQSPSAGQSIANITLYSNILAIKYHVNDYEMNLSTMQIQMTPSCVANMTCSSIALQSSPPN
jgi:hypothetical protein